MKRHGTSFVETLLAAVLVGMVLLAVGGGMWSWARSRRKLELHERGLSTAAARLELLTSLPAESRPEPGRYDADALAENADLGRVLEPKVVVGTELCFSLEVEEHRVSYPDYFFGGAEPIPYLDFHRYRIRVRAETLEIELVTLK